MSSLTGPGCERTANGATEVHNRLVNETANLSDTTTPNTPATGSERGTILRAPQSAAGGSISIDDLQALMVAGLPALETAWIGRWLLRASDGYASRANSALPLGDPGMPLAAAIRRVEEWYAAHGQTAVVQLYGRADEANVQHVEQAEAKGAGAMPNADARHAESLGAELARRGWHVSKPTLVMTADCAAVAAPTSLPGVDVAISPTPTAEWWAGAGPREQAHRSTLARMLARVDGLYVAATTHEAAVAAATAQKVPLARTAAVARAALSGRWVGVFDVHVQPHARRMGLGRLVVATAAAHALARGVQSVYLQVGEDNTPAVALYRAMGFVVHHRYCYATRPDA